MLHKLCFFHLLIHFVRPVILRNKKERLRTEGYYNEDKKLYVVSFDQACDYDFPLFVISVFMKIYCEIASHSCKYDFIKILTLFNVWATKAEDCYWRILVVFSSLFTIVEATLTSIKSLFSNRGKTSYYMIRSCGFFSLVYKTQTVMLKVENNQMDRVFVFPLKF